ncbi:hypothetical protein A0O21_03595 [Streptococcus pantholopis]|uniref:Uncharacterized protein n=1 Tax=Streptococcus pantholopis TaxID=1811193 RepID=A0A172Q6T2_9STRE|nr:hypothetical protein A0O21_03595 [Streptococcus pantholopis]
MFNSNKIQRPLKTQKENRERTDESPDSKSGHLFPAEFRPCSVDQDTKPVKRVQQKDGKSEIFDFVDAPLPERLEGCGRL